MAETLTDLRTRIETMGEEEHKRLDHNFRLGQPLDWKSCGMSPCSLMLELSKDPDEGN